MTIYFSFCEAKMTVDYVALVLSELKDQVIFPITGKFSSSELLAEAVTIYVFQFILGCFMAFFVPALDYVTFYAQRMLKRNKNIKKIDHPLDKGF